MAVRVKKLTKLQCCALPNTLGVHHDTGRNSIRSTVEDAANRASARISVNRVKPPHNYAPPFSASGAVEGRKRPFGFNVIWSLTGTLGLGVAPLLPPRGCPCAHPSR